MRGAVNTLLIDFVKIARAKKHANPYVYIYIYIYIYKLNRNIHIKLNIQKYL